jgi:hypothetical protein
VVPIVVAVTLTAMGLLVLGRTSIEAAERRSTLVGQLRFAATLQDLRTVIVLRRQLAMELPRLRPWVRVRVRGTGVLPVVVRDLRGVMRWPAARLARLVLIGVVAGLCLRGVWSGTTPLFIVAGLALFLAGLDTVEPLAQEVDHPSRRDASPLEPGVIHVRHLPMGAASQVLVAAVAMGVAMLPGGGQIPAEAAGLGLVPLALAGLGGAVVSTLSDPPSTGGTWSMAPPEAQGMRLAFRTAWPPTIAVLGVLPVLLARDAVEAGDPAAAGAVPAALGVGVLVALVIGWVRVRDDIGAWWSEHKEQASGTT